jgi:isopenicillin-N N-acyltransferase-like protein
MSTKDVIIHSEPIPIIDVKGSHREIGRQIGEATRPQVEHSIVDAHMMIDQAHAQLGLDWKGANTQARKYLPFAEETYPEYVDEIRGIAEGANVKYDDLVVLNALEAVAMDALHLTKCTSLGVDEHHTANKHVLMAHNEDWLPEDEPDGYLVRAKVDGEPPWLAMTYGGLLPNIGLNAEGMGQTCDSVYPSDIRIGIPRVINSRAVLAATTISEAIRNMTIPLRAAGYNHMLGHVSGELFSVEVSARQFAINYAENGYIVHTNHYLDKEMQMIETDPDTLINTRVRFFRAKRLLCQTDRHTHDSLKTILRDHVNFPDSICNHDMDEIDPRDREKTINSLIMDLNDRTISIAWGSPCKNEYHTYRLEG